MPSSLLLRSCRLSSPTVGTRFRLIASGLMVSAFSLALRAAADLPKLSSRTGVKSKAGPGQGDPATPALTVASAPSRGELFFIDADVADPGAFWLAAPAGATVVCIPAHVDPWQFMAQEAAQFRGLAAIHIVSHGEPGSIVLNRRRYTADDFSSRATQLRQLGRALGKNGDILLYGCETGEGAKGATLVTRLADLTGADVGASSNPTGGLPGDDWNLEVVSAPLAVRPVAPAGYAHELSTITVTSNADSGAGTLRAALASASNGDLITFNAGMTIALTSGQLVVNKNVTIEGDLDSNGTPDVTITANYTSRVMQVTAAGAVALDGLIIEKGLVYGNGGNSGDAGTDLSAPGLPGGSALGAGLSIASGTVTITHSTISGNRAAGGGGGSSGGNGTAYGGGGGGGYGGIGGGTGGISFLYYNGGLHGYSGVAGSGGAGGDAGNYNFTKYTGKGGSISGGAGGAYTSPFGRGGAGATAGGIGGGGGGAGYGGAAGGAGGSAAAGMYIAPGATVYLTTSTLSNNAAAGGGGGGSATANFSPTTFPFSPTGAGGLGGAGAGVALVAGTLHYNSGDTFSPATNVGMGGSGGGGGNNTGSQVLALDGGSQNIALAVGAGVIDSAYNTVVNTAPTFVGASTTLSIITNAAATDATSLLHASDTDSSQTETWTRSSAPTHGTLTVVAATAASGSTDIAPPSSSITYTPSSGFAGTDSFTVQVSDGTASATRTISVNVTPLAPGAPDLAAASDSGSSSTDNITNATSLSFSGTNTSGDSTSTVRVFVDKNGNNVYDAGIDPTVTTTAGSGGTWTVTGLSTAGVADGTYDVYAVVTSATGSLTSPLSSALSVTLDTTAPTVSPGKISLNNGAGPYKIGDTVTATWDNSTTGNNNPDVASVAIDFTAFGGASVAATNSAGKWSASYTIVAGSSNLSFANAVVTATDTAGNVTAASGSTNATVNDATATITSVAVPANGTYHGGQVLTFTVNTSAVVVVTGTPQLALTMGSSTVAANYVSGSGTMALTFSYTVAVGNNTSTGISVGGLSLNGGTMTSGGNPATLTFSAPSGANILINTLPVVTTAVGQASFVAGDNAASTPVVVDGGVTVSDPSQPTLTSATVQITGNLHSSEDQLSFTNVPATMGNIAGVYVSGAGLLTLTSAGGSATLAQWQAALRTVTYTDSAVTPNNASRTVSFTVNDGVQNSVTSTRTITVADTDQTPIVTSSGSPAAFVSGAGPVIVDAGLTVSDLDSPTLPSGTVTIGSGLQSGDTLTFTGGPTFGNISGSFNSGLGVLALTSAGGTATLAQWQAALRSVTFNNPAITPNTTSRTVSFAVSDGTKTSTAASDPVTVAITPVIMAAGGPANATYSAGQTLSFTVTFNEPVTVSTAGGTPSIALTIGGASHSANYLTGSGTNTLTFSYTVQVGDNAAGGISITSPIVLNGGTVSGAASTNAILAFTPPATGSVLVNTLPTVATSLGSTGFTAGDNAVSTPVAVDSALTVADPSQGTLASANITLTGNLQASEDVLSFTANSATMGNIAAAAPYNAGTGTLILTSAGGTATLAQWQAALEAVTYTDTAVTPSPAARTVTFTVNDGVQDSAAATKTITVADTDQTPILGGASGTTAYLTTAGPVAIDSGLTVSDRDSLGLASATVSITGNFETAGDVLGFANAPATTGNINVTSYTGGVLTLTSAGGTATLAQWQAALDAVTFRSTLSAPSTAARTVSFAVSDGTKTSAAATQTVTVALPITPTFTWTPTAITYGAALSSAQLDAVAKNGGATVAGIYTYTPATGTVLGAGSQSLGVSFVPTDAIHYTSATGTATLVVSPAAQSITLVSVTAPYVGSSVTLGATASSGGPITYTLVSGNATLLGNVLTPLDTNPIVIQVSQTGGGNYYAATAVTETITALALQAQTISFTAPVSLPTTSAPLTLTGTATSGLPVTYTVTGVATVSGNTLTLSGVRGSVTVIASQAGNAQYAAAPSVSVTISITGRTVVVGTVSGTSPSSAGSGIHPAVAAVTGTFAASVDATGTSGTLIGYIGGSGFVVPLTLAANGSFHASTTALTGPGSVVTGTLTFDGQLVGNTFSGSIAELNASFSATVDPAGGSTAGISGYYQGASLDSAAGGTYSIVGTQGEVFVLAITPGQVVAGTGTVAANDTFTIAGTPSGSISGTIIPASLTISETLTTASGVSTPFTGLASTAVRTDRLINLSSRGMVSASSQLYSGLAVGGTANKMVLLRAVGPGLAAFGVPGVLAQPHLQLFNATGGLLLDSTSWSGASSLMTVFAQVGAFPLPLNSADAAMVVSLAPGVYTLAISNAGTDAGGIAMAEIYDASATPTIDYQRLVNISSRATVGTGAANLTGGFIIAGNNSKKVLVRGIGPGLAAFGVANTLTDPVLTVFDSTSTVIAQNDNWGTPVTVTAAQAAAAPADIAAADLATGAFALTAGSKDAAVIVTLAPGAYTAQVTGAGGATGVALVEIYEIPQ